jgi:hypothetical protein
VQSLKVKVVNLSEPDAKTLICGIKNGELYEHELPKLTPERSPIEEELDLATFKAVWLGQQHHEYGKWP